MSADKDLLSVQQARDLVEAAHRAQAEVARFDQAKIDRICEAMAKAALRVDANDTIYQYEASTDYNPSPVLEKIQAPLFAVNSADDEINPPELGILEREITKVKRGRYTLIPLSDQTRGHQTYNRAVLWKNHLLELLRISEPRSSSSVPQN